MTSPLPMFKQFMTDEDSADMFITGQAGTGKTTALADLITYCKERGINYMTCAFTHKACRILRSKLPPEANVSTLHKFLRKRPTVNTEAKKERHIQRSIRFDNSEQIDVLFVDEFSMVGEKDLMDIREAQERDDEETPEMKIVWIGDLNQLPPVNDMQTVNPHDPYWCKLTKIYRQAKDNPLIEPLTQLVSFIEKRKQPEPLVESSSFIRNCPDLIDAYQDCTANKIYLAYTNQRVQEVNFAVQGRTEPEIGDMLFSPMLNKQMEVLEFLMPEEVIAFDQIGQDKLEWNTKYNTLENLIKSGLVSHWIRFIDEEEIIYDYPVIFGTANYKRLLNTYGKDAAQANAKIQRELNVDKATEWAKKNWQHPLARERAKAWSSYLTVNRNIVCFDFNHAMTVHKSQGSTFETVFLDTQDLSLCANRDYDLYLKLMYVGLSRASNTVVTN